MNGVAEIATRKLARLQQDSFAARPIVKLRSTGTLFSSVTPDNQIFKNALQKYFAGEPDHLTLERL